MSSTETVRRPRTRVWAVGLAALALVGVTACRSQPSNERVVRDIIETQGTDITDAQRQCMSDVLDSYDNNTLDKIAQDNQNYNTPAELAESGTPEYQQFVADFSVCMETPDGAAGAPVSSDATSSDVPSTTNA